MPKIIRLTEKDLTRLVKKIVNEHSNQKKFVNESGPILPAVGRFFSRLVGRAAQTGTDDVLKLLNNFMRTAFENPKNIMTVNSVKMLRSANPKTPGIPVDKIDAAIEKVLNNQMTKENLLNGVPRVLPDGTLFRDQLSKHVDDLMNSIKPTKADYRGQVSQSQSKYGGGSN